MMEKMRYITQRALTFPKDKPRLSYWTRRGSPPPTVPRERTQQAYAEAFSAHTDFCRNTIGVTGFPLGRIVDIPDLTRPDDFYYTKLLTWISPPESLAPWGDRVIRKPKGNYAVILHQGGTSTVAGSYEKLLRFVKKEGLALCRAGARAGHELLSHVGLGRGLPAAHLGPRGGLTRGWSGGPRRAGHRTSRRGAGGYAGADGRAPA